MTTMGRSYRSKSRTRRGPPRKERSQQDPRVERAALLPIAVIAAILILIGASVYIYLSGQGSDGDEVPDGPVDDDVDDGTPVDPGYLLIPLENVQGGSFKLNDYRGRVVVLDMMATWCGPCRTQMVELRELRQAFSPSQLEILSVGVDLSESAALLRDFKTDEDADWPFASSNQPFNEAFPASSIPTIYVLDQNGKVVKTHVGVTGSDVLRSDVSSLLV